MFKLYKYSISGAFKVYCNWFLVTILFLSQKFLCFENAFCVSEKTFKLYLKQAQLMSPAAFAPASLNPYLATFAMFPMTGPPVITLTGSYPMAT